MLYNFRVNVTSSCILMIRKHWRNYSTIQPPLYEHERRVSMLTDVNQTIRPIIKKGPIGWQILECCKVYFIDLNYSDESLRETTMKVKTYNYRNIWKTINMLYEFTWCLYITQWCLFIYTINSSWWWR